MEAIQAFEIIFNFRLHQDPDDIEMEFAGQFSGVLGLDQPFRRQIAHYGFEVFDLAGAHLLDLPANVLILRALFAAERAEGAAEDLAEAAVLFRLILDDAVEVFIEAFERRELAGENLIEERLLRVPKTLESGDGQVRL